jgi:hypothetical protein
MVRRDPLWAQTVGSNLMGGASETDRPDRVLLTVTYDSDDRHCRKIRRCAGNHRSDEKG